MNDRLIVSPVMRQETSFQRAIWLCLAWLLAGAYLWTMLQFLIPAHGGVDQNGYLLGGRNLAQQHDMVFWPAHPVTGQPDIFRFVGRMWIGADLGTPEERYYPKYPIGYPALIAAAWKLAPEDRSVFWAYAINPIATALGLVGTFYLARRLVSGFLALLAMTLLAVSPVTLGLATVPNSHATTLMCVAWGMAFLIAWYQEDRWAFQQTIRALAAGLLLGYALTIRYTEGLLLLPMLLAMAYKIQQKRWRLAGAVGAIPLMVGWLLPVALLLAYNRLAFDAWTGYDPTGESVGFRWSYFQENWSTALEDLADTGLLYVTPLAVAGLAMMFHHQGKLALLLTAWVLPTLLLYISYYWAPDGPGLGYPRFFLTIFPAMVIAAVWLIGQVTDDHRIEQAKTWWRKIIRSLIVTLGIGVIVALAVAINLHAALPTLEREVNTRAMLSYTQQIIQRRLPGGSLLFSPDSQILHHLQFVGETICYQSDVFDRKSVQQLPHYDPDEPQAWQAQRRQALYDRLKNADQAELNKIQNGLIAASLKAGHRVFILAPQRQTANLRQRLPKKQFQTEPLANWSHPLATSVSPPTVVKPNKTPRRQMQPQRFDRKNTAWELVEVMLTPAAATTAPSPALLPASDPRLEQEPPMPADPPSIRRD